MRGKTVWLLGKKVLGRCNSKCKSSPEEDAWSLKRHQGNKRLEESVNKKVIRDQIKEEWGPRP